MSDTNFAGAAGRQPPGAKLVSDTRFGTMLPRVLPFAVFIAFLAAQPLLEDHLDTRWVAVARGLAAGALLLWFWRHYVELRAAPARALDWLLALALGAAVFGIWITFDHGWATMGEPGKGFVPLGPDGRLDATLVALRLAGLALVVPLMEELFWRSFVMRWIAKRDFLALDPARVGFAAFAISSALFALEHAQWFAGLLAGAAYGWLYMRSRNLWIPIASHATTNALLGVWILASGSWHYW